MNPPQEIKMDAPNTANGQIGNGGSPRMWGFSLEFWESVFLWATGIAAVAGGVSVLSAFVAGIIGYRTADVVQKDMTVKLAQANARAAEAHLALEKYKDRAFDRSAHKMQGNTQALVLFQ